MFDRKIHFIKIFKFLNWSYKKVISCIEFEFTRRFDWCKNRSKRLRLTIRNVHLNRFNTLTIIKLELHFHQLFAFLLNTCVLLNTVESPGVYSIHDFYLSLTGKYRSWTLGMTWTRWRRNAQKNPLLFHILSVWRRRPGRLHAAQCYGIRNIAQEAWC